MEVKVDVNQAEGDVAAVVERLRHARPAWAKIGTRLRNSALRNFREGGVWPGHWLASQAAQARGGQTLVKTATLRNSIAWRADDESATCGTDKLVYAAVHQFGATIRAKTSHGLRFQVGAGGKGRKKTAGQWITKQSVTIPARPFLPVTADGRLSPDDTAYVRDTLSDFIAEGLA